MPRLMVRRGCSPEQHYWIGSPEQLPACGGLPVDRTGLLEGGLYKAQVLRPVVAGQNCAKLDLAGLQSNLHYVRVLSPRVLGIREV